MKKLLPLLILTLFLGGCASTGSVQTSVLYGDELGFSTIAKANNISDKWVRISDSSSDTAGKAFYSRFYSSINSYPTSEGDETWSIVQRLGTPDYIKVDSGDESVRFLSIGYASEAKAYNFHPYVLYDDEDGDSLSSDNYLGHIWALESITPLMIPGIAGSVVQDSVKHTLIGFLGTRYEGVITEGTKEKGSGVFVVESGERKGYRYEGEFLGEKFHGQGTITWPDGAKYVGEWKDGKYHGQGTSTFPDGAKYVGEWKYGEQNGHGTATFSDGRKYVGELKYGKYDGQGTLTVPGDTKYPDGWTYIGEWKEGKRNGMGTNTWAWGAWYVGEWKDDKRNGKGVGLKVNFVLATGYDDEILSGTWVNDTFQLSWTINAVSNFLKNKYPQFIGFDFETPTPAVIAIKSSGISISGFIAVLEFEGNDISVSEARALTNRLRSELVGKGQLTIIERGKMEEILKEQAFQQTGCVSSECAVEVGKMLGVQNIITGSISKVGTIYSVEARAVSVETGEIIKSAVYDHSGNIGGLLTQGMRKVAEELGK